MVYLSPDPYHEAFEEQLDLKRFSSDKHPTAGICLTHHDSRMLLAEMSPSTPAAKIPRWRSRLRGAWLIKVNDTMITCIHDLKKVFLKLDIDGATPCSLLFSHPTIKHGLTNDGIPQINMDQLNNRHLLRPNNQDLLTFMPRFDSLHVERYHDILFKYDSDEHDVWNATTRVMKLTRGKLRKQDD